MCWFYFTVITLCSTIPVSTGAIQHETASIGDPVDSLIPPECPNLLFTVEIWSLRIHRLCKLSRHDLWTKDGEADTYKTAKGLVCSLVEFQASDQGMHQNKEGFFESPCRIALQNISDCGIPVNGIDSDSPTMTFTYTCLLVFDIADKDALRIACQQNGTWEPIPICTLKTTPIPNCGTPGNGINTDSPTVTGTTYLRTATYTCLPGFDIADKDDLTITCQQNGAWEPVPKCTLKSTPISNCGTPGNGIHTDSPTVNDTTYKSNATYTCLPGFDIANKDDLTITCQQNGTWKPVPICTQAAAPVTEALKRHITCPVSIDQRGLLWNSSDANTTTALPCANGYRGQIKRYCDSRGVYHHTLYNCTSETIFKIKTELRSVERWNSSSILGELSEIVAANNDTMYEGDLSAIGEILSDVTENFTGDQADTDTFYKVVDKVIDEEHSLTWISLEETSGNGAKTIIQAVDKANEKIMAAVMSGKMAENVTVDGGNLYVSVRLTDEKYDDMIVFPEENLRFSTDWPTAEMATISVPLPHGTERLAYAGTLYRKVSQLLSRESAGTRRKGSRKKKKTVLNSAVLSFSLPESHSGKLKDPVILRFKTLNKHGKSVCSFLNLTTKSWETNGCWEDSLSIDPAGDVITCKCNHLTNFALLMSPVGVSHVTTPHSRALSMLTICGITLSSVCLIVNIILYILFWRFIVSEANIIILNVCIILLVANGLFIFGVKETLEADVCTAIAVLLHFVYLALFMLLLAVGINLTMNALSTKRRKLGCLMCCLAYVFAGIIVGISAGSYRLEGYGNENFCWLGNDSGQIWTFIGPAIAVILTNFCLIAVVMRKYLGLSTNQRKNSHGKFKAAAKALGAMLSATGVTWLFGLLSVNKETLVFQYLFVVCNSLQGVFILIFYGITNTKIQRKLSERFGEVIVTTSLTKQSAQSSDRFLTFDA